LRFKLDFSTLMPCNELPRGSDLIQTNLARDIHETGLNELCDILYGRAENGWAELSGLPISTLSIYVCMQSIFLPGETYNKLTTAKHISFLKKNAVYFVRYFVFLTCPLKQCLLVPLF